MAEVLEKDDVSLQLSWPQLIQHIGVLKCAIGSRIHEYDGGQAEHDLDNITGTCRIP